MNHSTMDAVVAREAARRRTFAIISHPDAGKTTLTEKLLLYGGCVEVAGAVRSRKAQRAATSDWMELEKQRGISISSTLLSFEYLGCRINLLDTPGHHDFSEDTYRTLMAADGAVMVIDLAKGVETQSEKLFRVCALRGIPVLTFVNKVDRPGLEPLEILEDIERKLEIEAVACNWPLGTGADFCGVVDLARAVAYLFSRGTGDERAAFSSHGWDWQDSALGPQRVRQKAHDEIELVQHAGARLDRAAFLAGLQTPVFFGSALTNFGIEQFLTRFLDLCPSPVPRSSDLGMVPVARSQFAAFVFKIQANLDPRHRDRVTFIRVCSGKFERDMDVFHPRSGKRLRLPRAHRLFAQDRETLDVAFPGDIVGLVNPGEFRLGDTICVGEPLNFEPLPQFAPEHFAVLRCTDAGKRKQFERGLGQLVEEGAIQLFRCPAWLRREPILAAVGELQFDVVRFRLESEYNTPTAIQWLPHKLVRWVSSGARNPSLSIPHAALQVIDNRNQPAVLLQSKWDIEYCERQNPGVTFLASELLQQGEGACA